MDYNVRCKTMEEIQYGVYGNSVLPLQFVNLK